jgi:hypothetical protein
VSAAIMAALSSSGCGTGSADGLDRRAVSGKVTLDGAPLPRGVIAFDPENEAGGSVPAGGVITDGYYSIDASSGPTPGKYKVSIRSAPTDGDAVKKEAPGAPPRRAKASADPIPAKYNTASELTAEIAASGSSSVDFTLVSE